MTVIVVVALSVNPSLSVTVSVAVNVPADAYVWLGLGLLDVAEPSPKFQRYDAIVPSSVDPEPENDTVTGASPDVGDAAITAVGGDRKSVV